MAVSAEVTFFHDSSFMVRIGRTLLVFDYCIGKERPLPVETRLTERDMADTDRILFFVTSGREDHFDPTVYTFNFDKLPITYFVSDDIPIGNRGRRLHAGDTVKEGDVRVTAYRSTDIGVALYVEAGGVNIFYAGDLNFWHWRDESTLREIIDAEKDFYAATEPLEELPIDIAMFPVDPRQGGMFDAGVNYFIMSVKPRVLFPMHFLDKADAITDFSRRARTRYTEVTALTRTREKAIVTFDGPRLSLQVVSPAELFYARQHSTEVDLDALSKEDPFSDTDLPVDLN